MVELLSLTLLQRASTFEHRITHLPTPTMSPLLFCWANTLRSFAVSLVIWLTIGDVGVGSSFSLRFIIHDPDRTTEAPAIL